MSKQLQPKTGRRSNAIRILCASVVLGIVACLAQKTVAQNVPAVTSIDSVGPLSFGGTVASWRFSRSEDVDFDDWPEGWERKVDRDHPPYLPIRIIAHDAAVLSVAQAADLKLLQKWPGLKSMVPGLPALPPSMGDIVVGRYLRVELDGGWAQVQSPRVVVDPLYRYQLELSAKAESLVHDHVYAELTFLDAAGQVVAFHQTDALSGTTRWQPLSSDLAVVPEGAVSMVVRLVLRPIKLAGATDIRGGAGFDDIKIRRLPQMKVETDDRFALYAFGERPVITVRVLGLEHKTENMLFIVRDAAGRQVAMKTVQFSEITHQEAEPEVADVVENATAINNDFKLKADPTIDAGVSDAADPAEVVFGAVKPESDKNAANRSKQKSSVSTAIEGEAKWQLPELRPGFYIVESLLGDFSRPALKSETTVAVLASLPPISGVNPYGWTMSKTIPPDLDVRRVPDWLQRVGVGVVKYPFWFAPDEKVQLDNAAWLVGRLQEKEIRTIGMLDYPPPSLLDKIDERERREPNAANYFRDATVWQPLLEPTMTRLSLKVRTWQLGTDRDFSFLGRPNLKQRMKEIARDLQGFGQPIGIALSWPWLEPLPPTSEQSWDATQLSTDTNLVAEELDAYLQTMESPEGTARERAETWVTLDPLEAGTYDHDTRITDMILRMATVRGYRVPATFVTDPSSKANGLLRSDWRPAELLLPWRTTAILLSDLTRIGSLSMPGGSSTMVLANASRTSIVVWNPEQTTEKIYLGDSIRQIDPWGNATTPLKLTLDGKPFHEINVGPVPTFLTDVDPVLVAFRMSTRLVEKSLDSLLGQRQTVSIEFSNPTRELMSGQVRMKPLSDWEVDLRPQSFDLPAGRTAVQTFDVALRNSAKIGEAKLEFDFLLRTQPTRRFTVGRSLHVGPDGLDIEVTTRLVDNELIIFLTMTNRASTEAQYDCMLFPPGGRQYQRRQILIPPGTTVKRSFPWEDGQSLIGQKMLLRAVEQNGSRVLNQVVEMTP